MSANVYHAWGIQNRRAPAAFKTQANVNFSLFGMSSGLNLLYSTNQSKFRQNLNTLGFNANWKWLTIQAGDVSPGFSKYGLHGITIRGGDIKLTPSHWQIELSGGRSKRRVGPSSEPGFRQSSYKRWSFAGKLGYKTGENHYSISTQYSVDENEPFNNSVANPPQENLTVTPNVQVSLFKQAVTLSGEVTVSAFTRDLNSPEIPSGSIQVPGFITGLMHPHTSSRINYAGNLSADLSMQQFGLQLGYERIQPGFRSLGAGRIRDDQQNIRISPSFQLLDNKLSFQGNLSLGRDNLLGTRLKTQKNINVGSSVQYSLTNQITISGNYNLLVNDISSDGNAAPNASKASSIGQKQVTHTVSLQPSMSFVSNKLTHSISLSGSYYTLSSRFKGGTSNQRQVNTDTYAGSLSYSLSFRSGLSLNSSGNFSMNQSSNSKNVSVGGNVGASYTLLDRKLTLSFNGGINQVKNTVHRTSQAGPVSKARQLNFNLTGNYQLSGKDTLSLSVRNRSNTVLGNMGSTYAEIEGTLNYQHQF